MVVNCVETLSQVAAYLKVPAGKINFNNDMLPTRAINKTATNGYFNIIEQLLKESKSNLAGCSDVEKALVRQWVEYAVVYAGQNDSAANINQTLAELNDWLLLRTYLVGHRLTIADIILYYVLYPSMDSLSGLDKEKFLNVSRWYDNLQQNNLLRQSNKILNFNTIQLACLVPARH